MLELLVHMVLKEQLIITAHYKHVDTTAMQLLE